MPSSDLWFGGDVPLACIVAVAIVMAGVAMYYKPKTAIDVGR